ncbi:hypothetical protein [Microbispora sp. CA-102843]|uniref:hypothetical protein n=1 Tax=Microbispora sp. CA-102843 TaxID=3239952 RepID=UPI003D8FC1E7
MCAMAWGAVLAGALVAGLPATAAGAVAGAVKGADVSRGTITSSPAHTGRAEARVWTTGFGERYFQIYGRLYDSDPHRGHCASVQAVFHYRKGDMERSPSRGLCSSSGGRYVGFLFESRGRITRVDLRVCVTKGREGPAAHCATKTIRA